MEPREILLKYYESKITINEIKKKIPSSFGIPKLVNQNFEMREIIV